MRKFWGWVLFALFVMLAALIRYNAIRAGDNLNIGWLSLFVTLDAALLTGWYWLSLHKKSNRDDKKEADNAGK